MYLGAQLLFLSPFSSTWQKTRDIVISLSFASGDKYFLNKRVG
jgi:hypothetical protein